jgi:hypothetical protein
VGGTGRSGTTIVARVLGADPEAVMIPIEARFVVDPGGLCDLVAGKVRIDRFEQWMYGRWWYRERTDGTSRGVHSIVERDVLDDAIQQLRDELESDRRAAAKAFVHRLFDPVATRANAARWIEMTPPNVLRGNELVDIMGDSTRLVHSMRDGRDVAASVANMGWGPNDPFEALEWWFERMKLAHEGCSELGPTQLIVVQLEDLVARDREATLQRLARFAGSEPGRLQRYLDRMVTADRAHIGRWTDAVEPSDRPRFDARYDELRTGLLAIGFPVPT